MIPVFALVGRPNVGKSTLFNALTRSRSALVFDQPGITRDRIYGQGEFNGKPFLAIDTGGITLEEEGMDKLTMQQSWQAIEEAHVILWLVDAKTGLMPADYQLAEHLRRIKKPVILVVNKSDGLTSDQAFNEFFKLGWPNKASIAAVQNKGITELMEQAYALLPEMPEEENRTSAERGIQVAVVGRPNVGKSTLINRLLGEERVVVFDQPGTTRDSIFIPFQRRDQAYTLIDTAGVRRKHNIKEVIEKFSVVKSLQAIAAADVVIFVFDAQEGVTDQDMHLLRFVLDAGRGLIVTINKWDGLTDYQRNQVKAQIDRRLTFVDFAETEMISAKHGTNVGKLWKSISRVYQSMTKTHSTAVLTRILEKAVKDHQPPIVKGHRVKLKYAHMGGVMPPRVVIHGNQTKSVSKQYERYLVNEFRDQLKLVGTPIHIIFKSSENPYEDKDANEKKPKENKTKQWKAERSKTQQNKTKQSKPKVGKPKVSRVKVGKPKGYQAKGGKTKGNQTRSRKR